MNIAPTCDPLSLRDETFDVAVVGAGVAGCTAAWCLAKKGVRVLLVDKASFPRFKVCGGTLNLRALEMLGRVGLLPRIQALNPVPIDRVHLAARGRQVRLELPGGLGISRASLDAELVRACIAKGVTFLPSVTARLGEVAGESRTLNLMHACGSFQISAKIILGADGLHGSLLKSGGIAETHVAKHSRIGAGVMSADRTGRWEKGAIYMGVGRAGYVGATVVEKNRIAIAAALDTRLVKSTGGLSDAAAHVLSEAGLPIPDDIHAVAWKGTPPLTRRPTVLGDTRVLALGDAAGYIEPFTGEGMAWAITAGHAIVETALDGVAHYDPALTSLWCARYRRDIVRRQFLCKGLAALLRRPVFVRGSIGLVRHYPRLADSLIRYINQPAI